MPILYQKDYRIDDTKICIDKEENKEKLRQEAERLLKEKREYRFHPKYVLEWYHIMSLMEQLAKEVYGKLIVEQTNDNYQTIIITVQTDCILTTPMFLKLLERIEEKGEEILIYSKTDDDGEQIIQLLVACHLVRHVDKREEDL